MKKIIIGVTILVTLFILFLTYDFMMVTPTIVVDDVRLIDAQTFKKYEDSYTSSYAVNKNESRKLIEKNVRLKKAVITFKYDHQPFLETICGVRGQYVAPENLPPVIVGKKPDMATYSQVKIYARRYAANIDFQGFSMTVLIDPQNYTDAEILRMLKSVEVRLVGNRLAADPFLATLPLGK